jgi:hypothetical protein
MTFPDDARRETRTALDALVHHVSQAAREQIDALRAAMDGRLAALEGSLAGLEGSLAGPDPCEPLERLVQDLSRAAADQAEAAATCARLETQEAAETQLAAARAEAQTRLEAERATHAALLDETKEEARQRVHVIQTAAEAERQSDRAEFEAQLGLEQAAGTELAGALAEAQRAAAATWNDAQAQAASHEAALAHLQALDGERTTQMQRALDEAEARLEAERATNAALLDKTIEEARQRVHIIQTAAEEERQSVRAEFEARLGLEQAASTELASALAEARQHTRGDAHIAPLDLDRAEAPAEAEAPRSHPTATRHVRRVKIQEGTEVLVDGAASVLVDLSPVGAQLLSPTVVRPNRSVRLSLPIEDGALACKARVVWAAFEQSRGDGAFWYRAGVSFTDVDTTAVEMFAIEHRIADEITKAAAG